MKKLVSLLSMVLAIVLLTNSVNVSAFNPIARNGLNEEDKYGIDRDYIVHLISSWKTDSNGNCEVFSFQVPVYTSYYWNNNFISQYKNSKISEAYKLLVGIDQIQYVSTYANTEKGKSFAWFKNNGGYSVLVGYLLGGSFDETHGILNFDGYRKFFYEYKDKGYTAPYEMWLKEVYQPLRNYIEYEWSLIDKKLTKRFKSYDKNDKNDKSYTVSLKKKYGKTFTYTKGSKTFTTNYKNFEYYDWTNNTFNNTYFKADAKYSTGKTITITEIGKMAGIYTTKADKKCKKIKISTLKKYGMPTEYRDKLVKGFELINEDVDRICDTSINKWMYQQFDRTLDELEALKIEMLYALNMINEIARYQFSPEHGAYSEYLWAYKQYLKYGEW